MPSRRLSFKDYEKRIDREGLALEMKQEFDKALEAFDLLLKEVEATSPKDDGEIREKRTIKAYLLMRKAAIIMERGDVGNGEHLMSQAVEEAEKSENPLMIGRSKLGFGVFLGSTGRFEDAERLLKEALSLFKRRSDKDSVQGVGWCLLNLGGLYAKIKRYEDANESLGKAVETLRGIENWVGVATALELRAKAKQAEGHIEQANKDLRQAIAFYTKQGMKEKAEMLHKAINKKP